MGSWLATHDVTMHNYDTSLCISKRIEVAFRWAKTIGGIARIKVRGIARSTAAFTFRMIAYNLIRSPKNHAGSRTVPWQI